MLISVIVPVYNVAPYLPKCIDSILAQVHHDLEIILIDDGSEDNSGTICDEYAKKDQRIQVIHQANGGQSSARNVGLDIATGDYIAFIDSDDFIMPNMFSAMLAAMEREDADLAICGVQLVNESGREVVWKNEQQVKDGVMDSGQALRAMTQSAWYRTPPNKLHKYSLWRDIRFPLGRIHEDEFSAHYILDKCKKVVVLEDKFYIYLVRSKGSTISVYSEKRLIDAWDAQYDRYLFFKRKGKGFWRCRRRAIEGMCLILVGAFEKLDYVEHKKVIVPLYKKTLWLLAQYGHGYVLKLFLHRHKKFIKNFLTLSRLDL
ncbi:MAG: glycosyltransferase family 2 protein [Clostridiales bacterium]|nr:glycosyltransferase family 2 protein [Clostridiales bacterium]